MRRAFEISRKAGRCANGAERDAGAIYHAIPAGHWSALCGTKPGRRSGGWAEEGVPGERQISCPTCKLRRDLIVGMVERCSDELERAVGGRDRAGRCWRVPGGETSLAATATVKALVRLGVFVVTKRDEVVDLGAPLAVRLA